MTLAPLLALMLGAELTVPAGEPLAPVLARARPGDVVRLGAGLHAGALGRLSGIAVEGAGAGVTVVQAPEGEDGAVAVPGEPLRLTGLSLWAGPHRSALKVLGGDARLDDVALVGGSSGAFVDEGRLEGREVVLDGEYGLLARRGEVTLRGVTASGRLAGVALLGGTLTLRRAAVTGPSEEAAITVAGGTARLEEVVVRDPGPTGLAVASAEVTARDLTVAGPSPSKGFLGDCVQIRRGTLSLSASELRRCGGAALEAFKGEVSLDGVDAEGGEAGGLVFTDGARARLDAVLVTGNGPGLVLAGGATARAFAARFRTDPVRWIDCGSGARLTVADAPPGARPPCAPASSP